jgi:hypothetical protein
LVGQLFYVGQGRFDAARLGQHHFTDLGQGQAPRGTLDQARAEFVFELGQLTRHD